MLARLAVAADEEAVVALARMQVKETLPHLDFSEEATRETFQSAIKGADPTIFVCEGPGREVIGYLMAFVHGYAFTSGLFVVQEALYVRPDKRGTRAAAHLVKQFVQWGEHMQAREIIFGISNGFQPDRTARFFEAVAGAQVVGYYLKRVR